MTGGRDGIIMVYEEAGKRWWNILLGDFGQFIGVGDFLK